MILMIYINDSNIFTLIYPYYISILLYRLYSTVLCIWLYMLSYALVSIFYIYLCTFMMIYRHEHIYSMHLPMLSSGTCFQLSIPFMAPMLLYFYMIYIAFVSWLKCFPLSHTHVSTYTHILYSLYICFHAPDGTIFLSHYTNYLIVFVLSRDIFYLCSIYTAKIIKFVQ